MVKFFGIEFNRAKDNQELKSFAEPQHDDGAHLVAGTVFGTSVDLDGTIRNESDLILKYRQIAWQPEVDKALNEIVNEAIVVEEGEPIVSIILDDVPMPDNVKRLIEMEFEQIMTLLNFQNKAYEYFKRWYIDGRHYYHVIIDEKNIDMGIQELRYIDPLKIRKIREVKRERDPDTGVMITKELADYYLYNEMGISLNSGTQFQVVQETEGIRINKDSIIYTVSGLMDERNRFVLSYLQTAIRPMNQLRSIEDSTLIYHLSRAPERRIFYVDTGSMPHFRAAQYISEMQNNMRSQLTYNSATGEVKDQSKTMSMLEDYWFQVREGGRGTKVEVMPAGTQLSQLLDTVQLFEDKLYNALQVPISRLKPDAVYSVGRATEITRDEINFSKFIDRIKNKFSVFFIDILEKQLVLRNIMTPDDFDEIRNLIRFRFQKDNLFSQLKDLELLNEQIAATNAMFPIIGKVWSWDKVRRTIWRMTDDEIMEEDQKTLAEMQMPQFMPPEELNGGSGE